MTSADRQTVGHSIYCANGASLVKKQTVAVALGGLWEIAEVDENDDDRMLILRYKH